jgi:hypothetical protein
MKIARSLIPGLLLAGALLAVSMTAPPSATGQARPADKTNADPLGQNQWSFSPQSIHHSLLAQSHELAQQYVKSENEDEKKDIRKKLTDTLDKQFDLHLKEQQKELDELEKQVAKLKAVLKKRKDAKENIVERRLEQLVQEADGLGWNAPGGRSDLYWGVGPRPGNGFGSSPFKSSAVPNNTPAKR